MRNEAALASYDTEAFGVHYKTFYWSNGPVDEADLICQHRFIYESRFGAEKYARYLRIPCPADAKPMQQHKQPPGIGLVEMSCLLLLHLWELSVSGRIVGNISPFYSLPKAGAYDSMIGTDRRGREKPVWVFELESVGLLHGIARSDRIINAAFRGSKTYLVSCADQSPVGLFSLRQSGIYSMVWCDGLIKGLSSLYAKRTAVPQKPSFRSENNATSVVSDTKTGVSGAEMPQSKVKKREVKDIPPYTPQGENPDMDITVCKAEPTGAVLDQKNAVSEIVSFLNLTLGTSYRESNEKTRTQIRARINEGFTVDDFKTVIQRKFADWGNDPKMSKYLRPETLFGTKFESYLNHPDKKASAGNPYINMSGADELYNDVVQKNDHYLSVREAYQEAKRKAYEFAIKREEIYHTIQRETQYYNAIPMHGQRIQP